MRAKLILSVLSLALSFAASNAIAQDVPTQKSTPAELVDALNGVFGKQTDNRAVHAKGIVLEGKFTPSPSAAKPQQGAAPPVDDGTRHHPLLGFCRRAGYPRHRPKCEPARHGGEISPARRLGFRLGNALL